MRLSFQERKAVREKQQVETAALWLDAERPDWAARIDYGLLDMSSLECCVLGQAFKPQRVWWKPWTFLDARCGYGIGVELMAKSDTYIYAPVFAYPGFKDHWIEVIADRRLSTTPNGTPHGDAVPVRPTVQMNVCSRP